jgi:predicted nuclease of restriction endonuclease-like (RecB) superfamily
MNDMILPSDYRDWVKTLKNRIQAAQQRAVLAVNQELLQLYWQIGSDILLRQQEQGWGSKVIERLAQDLRSAFPDLKGFSRANLLYMRSFAENWPDFHSDPIVQQAVGQIPWGHNLVLIGKLKKREARLAYAELCKQNGWSRNVLVHQIETRLIERQGEATSNFSVTLPEPQSELAQQTFKDPYVFDFLNLGTEAKERDIETALTRHVTSFLLELGAGFAFVGRQAHLEVDGEDYFIDLLFYHLQLRCYIVIELKSGDFKPEYVGKLSFYLSAVDSQIKADADAPSVGLLLCKSRNKVIAEYALRDNNKPNGIAEYQIGNKLPEELGRQLPSIERIVQTVLDDIEPEDAQ